MSYYKIILHGENLDFYLKDHDKVFGQTFTLDDVNIKSRVIGFFTTRLVKANNHASAVEHIKKQLYNEWKSGKYSKIESANNLTLNIDTIEQISTISGIYQSLPRIPLIADVFFRFATKGYTFYTDD